MKNRIAIVLGVVLAAAAALMDHALFHVPCSGFWACPDTPQLVAVEQRELMSKLREMHNQTNAPKLAFTDGTPEPLQVRVSQKQATLTTAGPMYEMNLYYAQIWYDVYKKNHPGANQVVYLHVVWPTGSMDQYFPITTL